MSGVASICGDIVQPKLTVIIMQGHHAGSNLEAGFCKMTVHMSSPLADRVSPQGPSLTTFATAGCHHLSSLGLRLRPLRGYDMILSSLIMFPVENMRWGGRVFAKGGEPDGLRPLWDAINTAARLCFPLPRKSGAGTEFVVSLFQDELDLLVEDDEFSEYAVYLSS